MLLQARPASLLLGSIVCRSRCPAPSGSCKDMTLRIASRERRGTATDLAGTALRAATNVLRSAIGAISQAQRAIAPEGMVRDLPVWPNARRVGYRARLDVPRLRGSRRVGRLRAWDHGRCAAVVRVGHLRVVCLCFVCSRTGRFCAAVELAGAQEQVSMGADGQSERWVIYK